MPLTRATRSDCEQPLRAVCRECEYVEEWRCDSYGCGPCGETKRRRLMRVIEDGSAVQLGAGLIGYFITLTAPGTADHSRWVQGRHRGGRPACECHLHGMSAGQWNRQESACWNRVRTALARDREVVFAGSVETQKRGMLHRHLVVFTDSSLTFAEVQEKALRAGYGCVLDVERLDSVQKAARYLAKYVTKSTAERAEVPWSSTIVDHDTGELVEVSARPTFRLWSSSRRWGVTMKHLRQVAQLQARARARYLEDLAQLEAEVTAADSATPLAPAGEPPP